MWQKNWKTNTKRSNKNKLQFHSRFLKLFRKLSRTCASACILSFGANCEIPTGFPKTEVHLSFSNMIEQSLQRFPLTTTSIQKLGKMGLLKVLTKKCLGQDSATVKKSSQLQAFDALTAEEKAKAFDELTPEDKLEVLDEQLRILERCAKVNPH